MKTREQLYIQYIQPSFDLMVDKIVYTYKFNTLANIDDLRKDCKTWLITILDKYDVTKGSKAFSYFSVITKNWFIHKVNSKKIKNEIDIDENLSEVESLEEYQINNEFIDDSIRSEFRRAFVEEIDRWSNMVEKDIDQKVYDALLIVFKDSDNIEIFNKKAIYMYMREISGLNTKQIVSTLKKFKDEYRLFKQDWDNRD
jgi:hypothetical protein